MSRAGDSDRLDVAVESLSLPQASGRSRQILGRVGFSLAPGEVAALTGPSGCGKTTLLRAIAGLIDVPEARVRLPRAGRLGFVFQEPRLLPWRDVETNVRLTAPDASDSDLDAVFAALGLAEHRRDFPASLSLGLARRVAIARALAIRPDVLLLDEPFVSLDAALALRLRQELVALIETRAVTSLIVTHNLDEAIALADRVLVLSDRPARLIADVRIPVPRNDRSRADLSPIRAAITAHIASDNQ
ncbi:MAG: NitT/TauT family transport system ATP-binding protein [Methylobacteriaceae bacterium]|jgi:NitT/TauT family transport system ATP-binding protein|nr:NitT/TauT family transport system ATP-binding protein [Methylobacteriaceae bacterium]